MRKFLFGCLLLLISSCGQPDKDPEVLQWEEQASRVTIVRDDFGVPHVYGKTDADAVFGMLYAQCEDCLLYTSDAADELT